MTRLTIGRLAAATLAATMLAGCVAPRPPSPVAYQAQSERAADSLVRAVQYELRRLLYMKGEVDGIVGSETSEAIRRFQRTHDLPVDGRPSPFLLDRLRETLSGY